MEEVGFTCHHRPTLCRWHCSVNILQVPCSSCWTSCFNKPSCNQILKSTFARLQGQSKALQKNLTFTSLGPLGAGLAWPDTQLSLAGPHCGAKHRKLPLGKRREYTWSLPLWGGLEWQGVLCSQLGPVKPAQDGSSPGRQSLAAAYCCCSWCDVFWGMSNQCQPFKEGSTACRLLIWRHSENYKQELWTTQGTPVAIWLVSAKCMMVWSQSDRPWQPSVCKHIWLWGVSSNKNGLSSFSDQCKYLKSEWTTEARFSLSNGNNELTLT